MNTLLAASYHAPILERIYRTEKFSAIEVTQASLLRYRTIISDKDLKKSELALTDLITSMQQLTSSSDVVVSLDGYTYDQIVIIVNLMPVRDALQLIQSVEPFLK